LVRERLDGFSFYERGRKIVGEVEEVAKQADLAWGGEFSSL
jgi:hypothetical protein